MDASTFYAHHFMGYVCCAFMQFAMMTKQQTKQIPTRKEQTDENVAIVSNGTELNIFKINSHFLSGNN